MITITDVAKRAGISKSTVSQYLNERYEYMADSTKKRIEDAIEELGYHPNIIARSLKQKSSTTIGVIVANILHEFSTQIIRAIEDFCNELDYHIIVCNADDNPDKEKKYIDMLRAKQVDGIIVFPTSDNVNIYKKMVEEEFPIVFMDRKVPEVDVSSVMLNNEKAAELAVEEFKENRYNKISIVTNSTLTNVTPRIERIQGFKNALEKYNLPVNEAYIKSTESQNMQRALKDMLDLPEPPQAILAGNDIALKEILKFVKDNNLQIPDDIALIGIDDVSFAEFYNPELTTIAQPTFDMGRKAAEMLIDRIKNPESATSEILRFEPKLIRRSL